MAFCSKCGSAVSEGSGFCSVCGSPVSSAGGPAASPAGAPPAPPSPVGATSTGLTSNIAAALSYFFITGIIFLAVDPYRRDKFVRFHSFQAIAFWVAVIVLEIVWRIIASVGFLSFGFFFAIVSLIGLLIWLAIFVLWLFLMYKAYNNERFMLPVIGEWASKQAGN
jgi:uncharacterized membrane protein